MRKLLKMGLIVGAAVAPVVSLAPRSAKVGGAGSVDQIVSVLRREGLHGPELIDRAIATVAQEYTHYCLWHLWETPKASLSAGRGWSHQYNYVLRDVLRGLEFDARMVHAARVRGFRHPWWHAGHAWVKVNLDGRPHDACASRVSNRMDDVGFTPVTTELPCRSITRLGVAAALSPFVVVGVWRAWLTGRPVSPWIHRKR